MQLLLPVVILTLAGLGISVRSPIPMFNTEGLTIEQVENAFKYGLIKPAPAP